MTRKASSQLASWCVSRTAVDGDVTMCLNGRDMVYFWEQVEVVIQVQTVLEFKPELDAQPVGRQHRHQVVF